jgi:hypothetical protein
MLRFYAFPFSTFYQIINFKQNTTMKKRNLSYVVTFIAIVALLFSCNQNLVIEDIENKDPNSLTINEAKIWFEKNVTSNSSSRIGGQDDKKPKWDKFYDVDMSIGKGMVISLDFLDPKFPKIVEGDRKVKTKPDSWSLIFSENHLSKLLMYKTKKGEMQTEIITSTPDEDYLARKLGVIENKDFCGNIIVKDWNGKFLRGYRFKNGKRIANFSDSVKSGRVALFACGQTDWFTVACSNGGASCTTTYMYTETNYCSECCSGDEVTVFPSNGDYNTSGNPNGQSGYTGISMTAAQKQALVNALMSKLAQLDPGRSDCWAERAYYVANIPWAIVQHDLITKARDYSDAYFCSPGLDNDNKNAYRHMMWNALMAKTWGYESAIFLSDLHECNATEFPLNHNMDIYNNGIGASYGDSHMNFSENSLGIGISNTVKNGLGRRIENGSLIPTNADGACTHN